MTNVDSDLERLNVISKELLEILLCPETKQPFTAADEDLVRRLNAAVDSGSLQNRSGETVARKLSDALLREDHLVVYPIIDGIPVLLVDEAISLDQLSEAP